MKVLILCIFLFFQSAFTIAQKKPAWDYFYGSSISETYKKLEKYLDFYQYNGVFSQIDTTLELTINHPSQSWTIYSTFFFDLQGRCYAFLNRRCDSEGHKQFQQFLADGSYGWKKIGTNKYLSKYSVGELLEVFDDNDCLTYKRTKLNLTRKQYKEMKDANF